MNFTKNNLSKIFLLLFCFLCINAHAQYNELYIARGFMFADVYLKHKKLYERDRQILKKNKVKVFFASEDERGYYSKNYVNEDGYINKIELSMVSVGVWIYDIFYDSDYNISEIKLSSLRGTPMGDTKFEYTEGALKSMKQTIPEYEFTDMVFTQRRINGELRTVGYTGKDSDGKHVEMDYVYADETMPPEMEGKYFELIDYDSAYINFLISKITVKYKRIESRYYHTEENNYYFNYNYKDNGLLENYTYLDTEGKKAKVYYTFQYR